MIPVSLRPRNFLSYGTAAGDLDFEAFSVACLSGGNGQGKSALLDAMTWAIWGEARKSSGAQKPDDELLRVGTRDMAVEFVFDLEGTRYRITRTYHRSASGKTSKPGLEFQVLDPESGDYRALTAESIRATQALIHERLGIDYDTFINSAFLLQGRSDEFTKKKPGERKEILGKILGLDRYDRLAAGASQRYSEAREQVRRLDERMAHLKADLEGEGGWKEEHAATAILVAELDEKRIALRAEE
ncbi:MAG: SMC family ATPase, partial [Rhodothermaceae bacterium]|nr:SMC family ATPase [Rhodothermaceae bacterium]